MIKDGILVSRYTEMVLKIFKHFTLRFMSCPIKQWCGARAKFIVGSEPCFQSQEQLF